MRQIERENDEAGEARGSDWESNHRREQRNTQIKVVTEASEQVGSPETEREAAKHPIACALIDWQVYSHSYSEDCFTSELNCAHSSKKTTFPVKEDTTFRVFSR